MVAVPLPVGHVLVPTGPARQGEENVSLVRGNRGVTRTVSDLQIPNGAPGNGPYG